VNEYRRDQVNTVHGHSTSTKIDVVIRNVVEETFIIKNNEPLMELNHPFFQVRQFNSSNFYEEKKKKNYYF
jgi:hypothetical protein